jgi:uncharacterized membrane protein YbhN (UPF0104 family)
LKPNQGPLNKNIKIIAAKAKRVFLPFVFGPLVFLLLSYLIYWQVTRQHNWQRSLEQVVQALTGPRQWQLWLALLLMPLNWGIEARKWQLALRPVGGIAFWDSFRAVFTGTTMGCFTPNRMGEYLGRILYIREGRRLTAISLTLACSIAQLMITLAVGLAGLLYLRAFPRRIITGPLHLQLAMDILAVVVFLALVILTIIYFRLSLVADLLLRIPGARRFRAQLKVLENLDTASLMWILCLSFGRYIVFIVQYSLVFPVFGVYLSFAQVWGGMSVVFLVMAVIPTFTFLTELGLRWEASIQVLEWFSPNTVGIFATSFTIWLINLIIPALIGSLFIVSIKLFKSR